MQTHLRLPGFLYREVGDSTSPPAREIASLLQPGGYRPLVLAALLRSKLAEGRGSCYPFRLHADGVIGRFDAAAQIKTRDHPAEQACEAMLGYLTEER